jgi:hypothetical protein
MSIGGFECVSSTDMPLTATYGLAVSSTKPTLVAVSGFAPPDLEWSPVSEVHVYQLGEDDHVFRPWRVVAPKPPCTPMWFQNLGRSRGPMSGGLAFGVPPSGGPECLFIATWTCATGEHAGDGDVVVWDTQAIDTDGREGMVNTLTRGSGALRYPDLVAAQDRLVAVATRFILEAGVAAQLHLFQWSDVDRWWLPSVTIRDGLREPCMMRAVDGGRELLLADACTAVKVFRTRDGELVREFGSIERRGNVYPVWGVLPWEDDENDDDSDEFGERNPGECLVLGDGGGVAWDPRRDTLLREFEHGFWYTPGGVCRVPGPEGNVVVIYDNRHTLRLLSPCKMHGT